MDKSFLWSVEDGIGRLTFNRPEQANALSLGLRDDMLDAITRVAESDARVVVLSGTGRMFCVGGDIGDFALHREQISPLLGDILCYVHPAVQSLASLPMPLICALNGPLGGGLPAPWHRRRGTPGGGACRRGRPSRARAGRRPDGGLCTCEALVRHRLDAHAARAPRTRGRADAAQRDIGRLPGRSGCVSREAAGALRGLGCARARPRAGRPCLTTRAAVARPCSCTFQETE